VRHKVSHPYKTTGKIIVLYILSFTLLDMRQEDKSSYWPLVGKVQITGVQVKSASCNRTTWSSEITNVIKEAYGGKVQVS